MIAMNMRQVVSRVVETLGNAPKHEECQLNLCLTAFEAKEDEIEEELVHWFTRELLQGQMKLHAKVIATTRQRPATTQASASTIGVCFSVMFLKFPTSKDHQAALQGHKGLARTKLGLDKDLTSTQQARKSKLWSLFKEAKATSKRAFWHAAKFFVDDTQISLPSSI